MNDNIHASKCNLHSNKRLGGQEVIAFRSMVDQNLCGSNPESSKLLFHFDSLISSKSGEFSFFPAQKRAKKAQKLFLQFNFFNVFLYVSFIYDKKQESKVLEYLSRLSINFWTIYLRKGEKYEKFQSLKSFIFLNALNKNEKNI